MRGCSRPGCSCIGSTCFFLPLIRMSDPPTCKSHVVRMSDLPTLPAHMYEEHQRRDDDSDPLPAPYPPPPVLRDTRGEMTIVAPSPHPTPPHLYEGHQRRDDDGDPLPAGGG